MDPTSSAQNDYDQLVDAIENMEIKLAQSHADNMSMLNDFKCIARQRLDNIRIGSQADTSTSNFEFFYKDGLKYLLCYTDGSYVNDRLASNSKRFALAAYFAHNHPLNFAKVCSKSCLDVYSSEVAAVLEALQVILDHTSERRVLLLIDNLEAKKLLEALLLEKGPDLLLPDLIASNPFLKFYSKKARQLTPFFHELRLTWVKAHTASKSQFARGNAAVDSLVRECLNKYHDSLLLAPNVSDLTNPDDPSLDPVNAELSQPTHDGARTSTLAVTASDIDNLLNDE